jgi:hypothetical protein
VTVQTTVEVYFTLTTPDLPYFRVGDPVKGKVGSAIYRLTGPQWTDISSYVSGLSITRGRNRDLDRFSAGKLSVTLNNETRAFDPLYSSSPFVGNIIPRRSIRVTTGGVVQFTGIIEDWNYSYDVSGASKASIVASDAFTLFATQFVTAGTSTTQAIGARIGAVLDMVTVAWPDASRSLDAGTNTVGADVRDGTQSALDYLNLVTASEQGQFFMSKNGYVTFIDRANIYTIEGSPAFTDDGTGIAYTGTNIQYGTDLLYNQVTVTSPLVGSSVANNLSSQTTYGISGQTIDTLISDVSQTSGLAEWWVSLYGDPEYRFEALQISLDGLEGVDLATVLGLELGDPIEVTFTPNGVGSAIVRYAQIIGVGHEARPDSYDITLNLSALESYAFLILDDASFGILDSNVLGF